MPSQVLDTLEALQTQLGDLPERVAELLQERLSPPDPPPAPESPFPEPTGLTAGEAVASPGSPAAATEAPWFPPSAAGAAETEGFLPPAFPELPAAQPPAAFLPPAFPELPAAQPPAAFLPPPAAPPAPELPFPELTGFPPPDYGGSVPETLPFPEPPSFTALAGGGGGLDFSRMESLLERVAAAVEGGGTGALRSSLPGIGLAAPPPAGLPWAAAWSAPAEGFPAASPSVNASSTAGLRGAGGFGYGSRLNTPPADFLEPSRRFPR